MIFVNFKTYEEATGEKAVELARIIKECAEESGVRIISVPQATDIALCVEVGGEVWAQSVDYSDVGKSTGSVLPEAVEEAGAKGTFLNHSESNWLEDDLDHAMERTLKTKLETLVFVKTAEELESLLREKEWRPTYFSYEPPELIASKDSSVASRPEVIEEAVAVAGEIPLIAGAGVKSSEDVRVSLEKGAKGVAVSSAVVLADDPRSVLLELAGGFKL